MTEGRGPATKSDLQVRTEHDEAPPERIAGGGNAS